MKVSEEMAREWVAMNASSLDSWRYELRQAYTAGFEKAMQMNSMDFWHRNQQLEKENLALRISNRHLTNNSDHDR